MISKTGYKKNSPDRNKPFLTIPSNRITMKGVEHPVLGISDVGDIKLMQPGKEYRFKGNQVTEINMKQQGGLIKYLETLSPDDQDQFIDQLDSLSPEQQQEIVKYLDGGLYQLGGELPAVHELDSLYQPIPDTGDILLSLAMKGVKHPPLNREEKWRDTRRDSGINYKSLLPVEQDKGIAVGRNIGSGKSKSDDRFVEKQQGGMSSPIIEVEDQETVYLPDGELKKFEGKKHSEGGIEVVVPGGSYIFSEHRKAPKAIVERVLGKKSKKKVSYADLSKKFPTKPYIDILEDSKDVFKQERARIQLAKNQANLETIFYAQETEKNKEKQGSNFQKGGLQYITGKGEDATSGSNYYYDPSTDQYLRKDIESGKFFETDRTYMERLTKPELKPTQYKLLPKKMYYPEKGKTFQSTKYRDVFYDPNKDQYVLRHTTTGLYQPITYTLPQVDINYEDDLLPRATTPLDIVLPDRTNSVAPQSGRKRSTSSSSSSKPADVPASVGIPDSLKELNTIPTNSISELSFDRGSPEELAQLKELTDQTSSYNRNETLKQKGENKFGIDPKLAGTIFDIGIALSDDLNIKNPVLRDRRKTPMFNRFVDFDDKEVSRMYSLAIKQVQQSNQPQQVKEARIADLTAKMQDYQAKVDFGNLQRYEAKRERDIGKLQQYADTNIDIRVADIENFREKQARVDYLKDQFRLAKKQKVVNSVKSYFDYVEKINYANQLAATNYMKNPFTGQIKYRPVSQSNLTESILQKYPTEALPKYQFADGVTGTLMGDTMVLTDREGKITTFKVGQ